MKIRIILFLLLPLIILSCASEKYSTDEKEFYEALSDKYRVYGDYKKGNYDWKGARLFYRKSRLTKKGYRLMPEKVFRDFGIIKFIEQDITYEQLLDMRDRMYLILNDNQAKIEYPEEVADLQFYYDCWVLEERLYTKYSQIARCKDGFINTLAYLEFKLLRLSTDERDLLQKNIDNENPNIDVFVRPKEYVIYFDFDSSAISEDSSRVIWEFLNDAAMIKGSYIVNVVGHADRVGSKKYNEKLSKRRTDTVKHYLVKNGIPEQIIRTNWQGEIDPRVITNNDFKETLNRRVVITIELLEKSN